MKNLSFLNSYDYELLFPTNPQDVVTVVSKIKRNCFSVLIEEFLLVLEIEQKVNRNPVSIESLDYQKDQNFWLVSLKTENKLTQKLKLIDCD